MPPAIRRSHLRRALLQAERPYRSGAGVWTHGSRWLQRSCFQASFWNAHGTHPGHGQGHLDTGSQYRSAIVTATRPAQTSPKPAPPLSQGQLTAARFGEITTEIVGGSPFFFAGNHHQAIPGEAWQPPIGSARQRSGLTLFQASAFLLAPEGSGAVRLVGLRTTRAAQLYTTDSASE